MGILDAYYINSSKHFIFWLYHGSSSLIDATDYCYFYTTVFIKCPVYQHFKIWNGLCMSWGSDKRKLYVIDSFELYPTHSNMVNLHIYCRHSVCICHCTQLVWVYTCEIESLLLTDLSGNLIFSLQQYKGILFHKKKA